MLLEFLEVLQVVLPVGHVSSEFNGASPSPPRYGGLLRAAKSSRLGALGRLLERSWAPLGASWSALGASWALLGGILGRLGRLLGRLGVLLGRLGRFLEASLGRLENLLRQHRKSSIFGAMLGPKH